ncbi:FeoA family protein [Marinisporobacter balticus]|uniref:Ferrous iron transport protein A n=1 Tax=Marinisporobacter balticus TaxID=2018667 RepID=A0A4R2L5Z9_9FIRM|nr:FeoA family protein [Marinisporobacter balticus]TCO78068.1 ferrous iron transport protein A [Marinisporobacter balticus]
MKNSTLSQDPIPLSNITVGTTVQVLDLKTTGLSRRRMLDLGIVPGTIINVLRKSPLGDPIAYNIRGATIALRKEESSQILVNPI